MGPYIITGVVCVVLTAIITWLISGMYRKKVYDAKIGSADTRAREIIDEALKTAETKKREALLEAKEESLKTKNELEKETKERRSELQRYEKRVFSKEEAVLSKEEAVQKKERALIEREEQLAKVKAEVDKLNEQRTQELERISGLTSEQAKDLLLKTVEDEVKLDTAKLIKEMEARAKEEAGKKAKEYVVDAIQKCAADHVSETTISVVQLPNDEMKGRIIGREGRNIRAPRRGVVGELEKHASGIVRQQTAALCPCASLVCSVNVSHYIGMAQRTRVRVVSHARGRGDNLVLVLTYKPFY